MRTPLEQIRLMVSDSAAPQWLSWVEELNGSIYHSIEWGEMHRSNHSRPLFLHWMDDNNRCVGIAVGIEYWSPTRYIGRFSKRLEFESHPAVNGGNVGLTRSMIKGLAEFAKKKGYRSLTLQSYFSSGMIPGMDTLGFVTTPRIEFTLDLTLSEEELWKRLSAHHRRKIGKANKHDLLFEEVNTLDAIRKLRKLMVSSADRRLQREPGGEESGDPEFEDIGMKYLDSGLGRLFLMVHEKQAVSGAFVSIYRGKALYVFGGSSPKGFELDVPALLFWKIFSRARELGCKEFNLGGVPGSSTDPDSPSHGLYRFKSGFGGRQVICMSESADNISPSMNWLARIFKRS